MTRPTKQDPALRASTEWSVLTPILLARGEASGRILAAVSVAIPPPLHQWFAESPRKAIAVALDAALKGEIGSDHASVSAYLSGLPHGTLHEIVTGKPVSAWKAGEYEGSALASIGGFNALNEPVDAQHSSATQAPQSAKVLRHLVERDRAIDVLRDMATEISRCDLGKGPTDAISQGLDRLGAMLSGGSAGRNLGDCLLSAVDSAQKSAELRGEGHDSPCTWGLPALDRLCPMRAGALYILSAPPGAGKTSLALQSAAATALAGGKGSVALVSLEMTGEELATILVARETGLSPAAIREWSPAAAIRSDVIREIAAQWRVSEAMMVRDLDAGGQRQTAAAVTAWLRQRKTVTANRLALGVIDYLGLLDGDAKQREYDTITQATRTIKRAAMTLRLPILCLAQMNRDGRKADRDKSGAVSSTPEPRLEDLRGSGSIEQDADAVVFIHLPDARSEEPSLRGKIIVAKHRGGATGSVDVIFHRRQQLFQEVAIEPRNNSRMSSDPSPSEDLYA